MKILLPHTVISLVPPRCDVYVHQTIFYALEASLLTLPILLPVLPCDGLHSGDGENLTALKT